MKKHIIIAAIALSSLQGCVSARKYEDLKAEKSRTASENEKVRKDLEEQIAKATSLSDKINALDRYVKNLREDSTSLNNDIQRMVDLNRELDRKVELLGKTNDRIVTETMGETQRMSVRMQAQEDALRNKDEALKKKEFELKSVESALLDKQSRNDSIKTEYNKLMADFRKRENRINDMERILHSKDSVVGALQKTLTKALGSFEAAGLNVTRKNGKVYVTLSEQLLFTSGSTVVEGKGKQALKELAKVLEANPEIAISIEGHTDDVPLNGSGNLKDNWDLSVLRATSVVRILTEGTKIDANRISASGRGEYLPANPAKTPDARKQNRRTEIILTPKLNELFSIMDQN